MIYGHVKIAYLPLFLAALVPAASAQKVLVNESFRKEAAALAETYPSLKFDFYGGGAPALEKIGEAEAFIGTPDEALMNAGKNLRWVHIYSAGIEKYTDLPGFKDGKLSVTSLKIFQGPEIADHAMALLLSLTRNLAAYQRGKEEANWSRREAAALPLIELRGRTMLVIGYGGIGTQVAERARAFGMTILAIDPKDIPLTNTVERFGKPDELAEFLPLADVVVSCVPHTPESEGMLGPEEFAKMKKGTYFVNVSRGKIVDTAALVAALKEGRLAGAGLDVVDPEPLPKDSPLWAMPNVVITPHVAGVSDARGDRQAELIRDNIGRFARGLRLKNLVDPVKGY